MNKVKMKSLLMITDGNIDQASARIRAYEYIALFEGIGYQVTLIPRIPKQRKEIWNRILFFPIIKRLLTIKRTLFVLFRKWDLIYVQRFLLNEKLLRWVKKNSLLIFDFDDAIFLQSQEARRKTGNMIRNSDLVFVSTPYLLDFCKMNGNDALVVPTPVDSGSIKMKGKLTNDIPVIGWIGSSWTTRYLRHLDPVFIRLSEKHRFKLITVGANTEFISERFEHVNYKWELNIEKNVLERIDIGIMPLPDDEFARAKGGYKLYLYMMAGIPCVASPVGINREIVEDGINGYCAENEDEWIDKLSLLLTNSELCLCLGKNGRTKAEQLYDRGICFKSMKNSIDKIKN
jgi:glycosyltransferase involved in cell wall biosynthesis